MKIRAQERGVRHANGACDRDSFSFDFTISKIRTWQKKTKLATLISLDVTAQMQ